MASDLDAIRGKVRRLTRSPSVAQLSVVDLDEYINTFILYDLPEHLRLFNLRRTLTFFTEPYIDEYDSNFIQPGLADFQNRNFTIHPPIYIDGYQAFFSQSREQFFGVYPIVEMIFRVGTGDGITTNFTGTLQNVPVLQNNVLFGSVDINNAGQGAKDSPVSNDTGNLLDTTTNAIIGTINYVTGVFTVTFGVAPAAGKAVNAHTVPYIASQPQALLYFNDTFTVRPVPDQPYRVNMEVYVQPTALLAGNQLPELNEWWQYLSYGAAKKVFEDRFDLDSVALIMPEFKMQERLVLRRTIVQQTNERTATIYTEQTGLGSGGNGWGSGGLF